MCIKLVIKTNLYYDARSEKRQIKTNTVNKNPYKENNTKGSQYNVSRHIRLA
jgi:hypothetical protein